MKPLSYKIVKFWFSFSAWFQTIVNEYMNKFHQMANKGNSESNKFCLTCYIVNIAAVTIPAPSIGSKLLPFSYYGKQIKLKYGSYLCKTCGE